MPEHQTGSGASRERRFRLHLSAPGAGFAIGCVAVATALRLALGLFTADLVAFALYYPAVLIASLVAGRAAGALALVLGGLMSWWAFMPPYFTVIPPTLGQALNLGFYVLASALIVVTAGRYRQLVEKLETREAALETELAEKVRREDALRRANERNTILLREVHHRVKNNLQIIVGLLGSHGRSVDNPEIRDVLREFRGRVFAIARLYDRIQQVEIFETVEFCGLLRAICVDIAESAGEEEAIHFDSTQSVVVATSAAITLAIVTNELITNALKNVSRGGKGSVRVRCEQDEARILIAVVDNGPGLASDFDFATSSGFGMNMVRRLIEGMGGVLRAQSGTQGATFEVEIPRNKAKGMAVMPERADSPRTTVAYSAQPGDSKTRQNARLLGSFQRSCVYAEPSCTARFRCDRPSGFDRFISFPRARAVAPK
jgi:two-component sensor histidine kinase